MYINSLELKNYRNYNKLDLKLNEGTTILYGENAQGKTNILEAMYLSATTKSHRGSKDKDIIKFNEDESHIRINVTKNKINHKIDMHLKKNKNKGVAIDGISIKKSSELFGILNIIFFSPEDLSIIKNGPAERRRFIDLELCQLNKIYFYNYTNYMKIINQRNNLLKQIQFKPELIDTLDMWDTQLVNYGKNVIEAREEFVKMINDIIYSIHFKLSGEREKIKILYDKNVSIDEYEKTLKSKRNMDIKYAITSVGPHRDDLIFNINEVDVRKFGSQGQQRTAALSLKLAEIQLVKLIIKDTPILLLDDVMSELDNGRKYYLLNNIKDIQTIITCTGIDEFINSRMEIDKIYKVSNGEISPINYIDKIAERK